MNFSSLLQIKTVNETHNNKSSKVIHKMSLCVDDGESIDRSYFCYKQHFLLITDAKWVHQNMFYKRLIIE